ncbi:MAG: hypothetical protein ACOX2K_10430 [Bacillota bacterium]
MRARSSQTNRIASLPLPTPPSISFLFFSGAIPKANRQAKAFPGNCSFFISAEQKVSGPLRCQASIQFSEQADPEIILVAQDIGISNINLQKIMSYAKNTGTNKISSRDIADCLSITVRGANRILNKIEAKGYAETVFEKREGGRGRPQKYYQLLFLGKNGDLL